jgi:riboflavin kinase
LCKRGAAAAPVKATTTELAGALRVSQQTVSRWLAELAAEGLVKREGKTTRLSAAACGELKSLAAALEAKPAQTAREKLVLRGVVVKGLGEGAKFMRLPQYARQLRSALGWTPFPGTLNLKLDAESAKAKRELEARERGVIRVKSFVAGNKRFGSVKLFPCMVKTKHREEEGAVILPEESMYGESVLEVVAAVSLRRALFLRDSDFAAVEI